MLAKHSGAFRWRRRACTRSTATAITKLHLATAPMHRTRKGEHAAGMSIKARQYRPAGQQLHSDAILAIYAPLGIFYN
jgi:hypothetical protein